jgi:hypothetical protein
MRTLVVFLIPPVVVFAGLGSGCLDAGRTAVGSYSDVLLVSENGADDILARAVVPYLTRSIDYYIDEEKAFNVEHAREADLAGSPAEKNIVICGVADLRSGVGRYIEAALGAADASKARNGSETLFERDDWPGPGQTTIVVTAPSAERLAEVIRSEGDRIGEMIEASSRVRLRAYLLRYRDAELSRKIHESYGFVIEVPTTYRMLSEGGDPPGIELLCEAPARLLGVYWVPWSRPPAPVDSADLFDIRKNIVWLRYDGDVMDSTRVAYEQTMLGDYRALRMSGYWTNTRSIAGGYYETYFVYDERRDRLWAIDLLVYSPGIPKHPSVRELRSLAETFRYD